MIQEDAIDFVDKWLTKEISFHNLKRDGQIGRKEKRRGRGPAPLDWIADWTIAIQTVPTRTRGAPPSRRSPFLPKEMKATEM